jgi:hypothetical protein
MPIDLKSLPITRTEIEDLLASETRPNIRKRLIDYRKRGRISAVFFAPAGPDPPEGLFGLAPADPP